jgi:hypothetical protein
MPNPPQAQGLPPPIQMLHLITGKWVSQTIAAIANLGVADQLAAGPETADTIAAKLKVNRSALKRVLRALASLGLFTCDDAGRFGLTELGATLRSDVPGSMRPFAQFQGLPAAWSAWGDILHSVRTGDGAFEHVHGETGFDYFAKHPEEAAVFDSAMTAFSVHMIPALLAAYDFSRAGKIVDVAGGRGHLLAGILKAHPGLQGVLFDMPHVIDGAKKLLTEQGVAARCEVVAGDFFQCVPSGADTYLLKHIVHDWDDARAEVILQNCRRAIAKTGTLVVLEMVIPPGNDPFFGKLLDLEMLVMTPGGRERSEAEYRALFARAGFALNRIVATESPISVVEGRPV